MARPLEKLETVLVVDDTPMILKVVVSTLNDANYNVLEARSGEEAIDVAANHPGVINLLLSDVQMPSMSGPELGQALKKLRPDLRIMLMSGLAGGSLLLLNYGWAFLEKPFLADKLLEMIDVVLHSPDKSQGENRYDTRKDAEKRE
jgi:two-component system, cell cycle sensor histidine kinase and response regulator CckA